MFYITYAFEILALLTGLIFYKRISPVIYRAIVIVLLITVVNEGLAHFKLYERWKVPRLLFYNIFFIIQIIVFCLVFYFTYTERKYKNIVAGITVLSLTTGVVFLNMYGAAKFNPYFFDAIALGIVLLACLYLYQIQMQKKIYHLKTDPLFWFSTALIIGNFFLLLFVNAVFIESFRNDPNSREIFSTLNSIGNVLYYGCIIISMLCSSQSRRRVGT